MSLLSIGSVTLNGFEVPSEISFGGQQQLRVHKLIGGGRIIDALGRDDTAVSWSGILSGAAASARARMLELMRIGGAIQALTWDTFSYSVIISHFQGEFHSPWWIPYQLTCEIRQSILQPVANGPATTDALVALDVAVVNGLLTSEFPSGLISLATSTEAPDINRESNLIALGSGQSTLGGLLTSSGQGLESLNLQELLYAAGDQARLSCAKGYLLRSIANLSQEDV